MSDSLFSMVIILSPLVCRILIYTFLLLGIIAFFMISWNNIPHQWKSLPVGLATTPKFFTAPTKPTLFLCHHKVFHIIIYLDDILVLVCCKQVHSFLCSLLVHFGLNINFPKSDLASLRLFVSWGYVGILSICQYHCLLIS